MFKGLVLSAMRGRIESLHMITQILSEEILFALTMTLLQICVRLQFPTPQQLHFESKRVEREEIREMTKPCQTLRARHPAPPSADWCLPQQRGGWRRLTLPVGGPAQRKVRPSGHYPPLYCMTAAALDF
ncbi:hypothetical protein NQZ68_023051 [Dissostichus eleginoides]|nr:hypothetical protein NQZ68_023051 [Dissostichus eleginoides]